MFLIIFAPINEEQMYQVLTFYHSIFRWLVVIALLYAIYRAWKGLRSDAVFSKTDDRVRHWTATICHVQLMLGIILYTQSPLVKYFWQHTAVAHWDSAFFSVVHLLMMMAAIVVITVGSAKVKRIPAGRDKFKTMLLWYIMGLLIILVAIPWPFSPLASRPYFR
jgi:uncharacterized membrane protein